MHILDIDDGFLVLSRRTVYLQLRLSQTKVNSISVSLPLPIEATHWLIRPRCPFCSDFHIDRLVNLPDQHDAFVNSFPGQLRL